MTEIFNFFTNENKQVIEVRATINFIKDKTTGRVVWGFFCTFFKNMPYSGHFVIISGGWIKMFFFTKLVDKYHRKIQ